MSKANYKDYQIILTGTVVVSFLSSTLNMFLLSGIFSKASTQKNFEKLKSSEFSRKYIVQFLHCKTDVNVKLYEKALQQRSYSSEVAVCRRL